MIKVQVLVENSSIGGKFKAKHGLSLLINNGTSKILLDTGPDKTFINNAGKIGADLSSVDFLVLSHPHIDHTGGLDYFHSVNSKAGILLFDDPENKYYTKFFKYFNYPIGIKSGTVVKNRIKKIQTPFRIDESSLFLKNSLNRHRKPSLNNSLYKKEGGRIVPDLFQHEGILVIRDKDELVLFNSCSHNGVMNTIDTVNSIFPGVNIRSYVGGFHLNNPVTGKNETDENLDIMIDAMRETGITFYTGHCTGEYSFSYIHNQIGDRLKRISTGMEIFV